MVCNASQNSRVKQKAISHLPFAPLMTEQVSLKMNKVIDKNFPNLPIFNYGFCPQTWNTTKKYFKEGNEKHVGDGGTLNIIDLSPNPLELYGVYKMRVIGGVLTIDNGMRDWKIFAVRDSCVSNVGINTTEEYEKANPGKLDKITEFIRVYKVKSGVSKKGKQILTPWREVSTE